jgi:hypothetical protein
MQEKYLGDTPDFGKYALLRALCNKQTGLRLGVNWYLTIGSEVDKPDNRDGNKRHHAANPQNYRPIDEELWDRLNQFQHEDKRSLEKFEGSGTLPKDTLYHSEPLSLTSFKGKNNKLQERERWIETGLKTLDSADLVFVDPDNGFEGSVQRHHKRGPKFTYYDEIKGFIDQNKTVVAIQFMGRQVGGVPALALAVKQKLKTNLRINGDIHILKNRAGKSILYFIIPAQRHSDLISNCLDKFLDSPASSIFEWVDRPSTEKDEIDAWLRKIAVQAQQTDSFVALREFYKNHPGTPVPDDLLFQKLYAPLLGEDEPPRSYEETLCQFIDELIAEEDRVKGGGTFSNDRIREIELIDQLRNEYPEMRLEDAAAKAIDKLYGDEQEVAPPPENDPIGNLIRSYHRYHAILLLKQIGDTVGDDDETRGTALISEYLRRMESSKTHLKTHND